MLPNLISILRLFLVPLIVALILDGDWALALYGFLLAGVSDAIDGLIARHFDMRTELGAYLDPLADKALLVSIFITLAFVGQIPGWLALMVVTRDIMIVGGIILAWLIGSPMAMKPVMLSKINTVAQIGFGGLVLSVKAFDWVMPTVVHYGGYSVAALTVGSMVVYVIQWLTHFSDISPERP